MNQWCHPMLSISLCGQWSWTTDSLFPHKKPKCSLGRLNSGKSWIADVSQVRLVYMDTIYWLIGFSA